jgi:hypothetical protein
MSAGLDTTVPQRHSHTPSMDDTTMKTQLLPVRGSVSQPIEPQRLPAPVRSSLWWPLGALFVLSPVAAGAAEALAPVAEAPTVAQVAAPAAPTLVVANPAELVTLPGGGRLWATEDPTRLSPQMNVSATSGAAIRDDQVIDGLSFNQSNNYAAFIQRMELLVFSGRDVDRVKPLTTAGAIGHARDG